MSADPNLPTEVFFVAASLAPAEEPPYYGSRLTRLYRSIKGVSAFKKSNPKRPTRVFRTEVNWEEVT
jgi:hypothetical protein